MVIDSDRSIPSQKAFARHIQYARTLEGNCDGAFETADCSNIGSYHCDNDDFDGHDSPAQGQVTKDGPYTESAGPIQRRDGVAPNGQGPKARTTQSISSSCIDARTSICEFGFGRQITVTEKSTGKVVGVWTTEEALIGRTDTSSTTYYLAYYIKLKPVGTGNISPSGVSITWRTNGYDGLPNIPLPPQTITFAGAGEYTTQTMNIAGLLSTRNTQVSGFFTQMNLLNSTTEFYDPFTTDKTLVRCDHDPVFGTNRKAGCVDVYWTPTVNFPASIFPYISQNIANGKAQFNGVGNLSNPLHRTVANRDANRAAACSTARENALIGPPPTDDPNMPDPSCDEYPFASSLEGGNDTVIKWVPQKEENSVQGGDINGLFTSNRVLEGDQFLVN